MYAVLMYATRKITSNGREKKIGQTVLVNRPTNNALPNSVVFMHPSSDIICNNAMQHTGVFLFPKTITLLYMTGRAFRGNIFFLNTQN